MADFQFFMAGAFSIAFSAINSIATHYDSTCEDTKKVFFQFFLAGAFSIAFLAINSILSKSGQFFHPAPPFFESEVLK